MNNAITDAPTSVGQALISSTKASQALKDCRIGAAKTDAPANITPEIDAVMIAGVAIVCTAARPSTNGVQGLLGEMAS